MADVLPYSRASVIPAARSYVAKMPRANASFPAYVDEKVREGLLASALATPEGQACLMEGIPPLRDVYVPHLERARTHIFKTIGLAEAFCRRDFCAFHPAGFAGNDQKREYEEGFQSFFDHFQKALSIRQGADFPLIAILHDVGKVIEQTHFHDVASTVLTKGILEAWGLEESRSQYILEIVGAHLLFGGLISREATPAGVLRYLEERAPQAEAYQALFESLLIFNLIDVAGYWPNFPPGLLRRYLAINSPEKVRGLQSKYFEVRLGTLCRTHEEAFDRGLETTEHMDELLRELDRQAGPDEKEEFCRCIAEGVYFHGIARSIKCLPHPFQIQFLRFVVVGAQLLSQILPPPEGEEVRVIVTDPMKDPKLEDSYGPFQKSLLAKMAHLPPQIDREALVRLMESGKSGIVHGFHIDVEPGILHFDLRS